MSNDLTATMRRVQPLGGSRRNAKKTTVTLVVIIAAAVLLPTLVRFGGRLLMKYREPEFRFVEIVRGDIKKTISSSGPLSPITLVDVGSQISGSVAKVYVDYNDKVEKDQVLAELDMSLLKAEVERAQGDVVRTEAALEDAQVDYNRNLLLSKNHAIAESVLVSSKIKVKTMEGTRNMAVADLNRAKKNLEYATIRSPIAGTVIIKNVEEGQTLAANFQTPKLFEIAEDISHMEILVAVDENDIGLIQPGQKATFEVQTYSGKVFNGKVKKVRLQPVTVANVVNYTVVVDVDNKDSLLMPGMTAEVDFIIAQKQGVLTVPKTALNFQPSEEMLKQWCEGQQSTAPNLTGKSAETDESAGTLWYIDQQGRIAVARVKTGISDNGYTELVDPGHLREGMQVISRLLQKDEVKKNDKSGNRQLMGMPGGDGGPRGGGPS
jgi:HlyD family secretion protein